MSTTEVACTRSTTLIDIELGWIYAPILIDLARHKHCLTYGELIERAKGENPDSSAVENAIPVGTGRRLEVVRMFTDSIDCPDLTCLIISKSSGDCGEAYKNDYNSNEMRADAYAYDQWDLAEEEIDPFFGKIKKKIIPRPTRTKQAAMKIMSDYYFENKETLPASVKEKRDEIIELLMDGFEAEVVFRQVVE